MSMLKVVSITLRLPNRLRGRASARFELGEAHLQVLDFRGQRRTHVRVLLAQALLHCCGFRLKSTQPRLQIHFRGCALPLASSASRVRSPVSALDSCSWKTTTCPSGQLSRAQRELILLIVRTAQP
jgi:hypothetical protein